MSSESKKMKPKTDFQPVLNYSKQHIWEKMNNDSGAGANAACRIDKTFSATEPLSEIIWTPDKGFSLKCVDSSFTNKNTSLFPDVGPSSMVLALLQSVTEDNSTTDKPIDDAFVEPFTVICTKSDVSSADAPSMHPTSDSVVFIPDYKAYEEHDTGSGDNMEKMNTSSGTPNLPNGQVNLMNYCEKNIYAQTNIETAIISERMENKSSTISGQVDQRPVGNLLLPEAEPKPSMEQNPSPRKHCNEGMDTGVGNQVVEIEDGLYTKIEHIIEYTGFDALGTNLISSGISLSKKLESTAKNDLQTFNREATSAVTSRVLVSKSNDNKNKSKVNYRIQMTRNEGKQKSLSDGDSNVRLSKEENDSHSSCESCHSTELFLAGKKRCKQEVILGSKRVKKKIQETSYSKSYVKRNSSFMNLISNMMKGSSQSTQDEGNQDPELKNAGLKSNFHCMKCPSLKNVGTRMSHQVGAASKDFELGKKIHGIDATPVTCYAENNSLCRQYMQSNKFGISKGRHDASPSLHPQIRPVDFLNSREHWKNNSRENKNCYNLGLSEEKEGMTLHSPSSRQSKNNNENVESWTLYERKEICHKSDTLGDLWITRFSPKSTSPLMIFDQLNERGDSEVHSNSMLPYFHRHISHIDNSKVEDSREKSADDQLLSEAKNLQNCCINKDASTGPKDDQGNIDHTSKHKFNPIKPFPGLRVSEPMVSMFARRLGAIKQCQQTL